MPGARPPSSLLRRHAQRRLTYPLCRPRRSMRRPGHAPHIRITARREGHHLFGGVISRLIALPGDLVRLRGTMEAGEVPEGHCWVEGDNPGESKDSRHYGPVPLDLLEGTVTHIVWPPRRVAAVPGRIPEERVRLLINPAGSVEGATGLGCLADSTVSQSRAPRQPGSSML